MRKFLPAIMLCMKLTSLAAEISENELMQDVLEGAGAFSGPTFKYKSIDDSEYKDEPVFSSKRWQYIYHDQEKDLVSKKYESIGFKTQKQALIKRHKKEQDKIEERKAKGENIDELEEDETFMEFVKYPPDFVDKDKNKRKYSYNDGIIYVFDTFGDMLDARY